MTASLARRAEELLKAKARQLTLATVELRFYWR
jgi:hypothetical protein